MPPKSKQQIDESSPLLQFPGMGPQSATSSKTIHNTNQHLQFCSLVGMPPLPHPSISTDSIADLPKPHKNLLYQRAIKRRSHQNRVYGFTASLANTLLLSQVVLGAALTALGAAEQSHVLIAVFGAMNTIIAGLVAYLKSRGQPMRARMYAEDLDRLVDDIENSACMWLGISARVHGYDAIDTDDKVTVRGEVARLTRLWEAAVRRNVSNDPDMYSSTQAGADAEGGLRARKAAPPAPGPSTASPAAAAAPPPKTTTPPPPTPAVTPTPAPPTPAAGPVVPTGPAATPAPVAAPTEIPLSGSKIQDKDTQPPEPDASPATAGDSATSKGKQAEGIDPAPVKEEAKPPPQPPPAPPPAAPPTAEAEESEDEDASPATTLVVRPSMGSRPNSGVVPSVAGDAGTAASVSASGPGANKANESLKRSTSGAPPGSRQS